MVSGNDDFEEDNHHDQDNNNSDVVMNGKETNGNKSSEVDGNDKDKSEDLDEEDEEEDLEEDEATDEAEMEIDQSPSSSPSNPDKFHKLIMFGQRVKAMLVELESIRGIKSEANSKMLEDAFALLAYPNPWDSPVGWQLSASEREFVSSALNSTLLEAGGFSARPPLEVGLSHAKQLVKLMANNELGACAFANLEDLIKTQWDYILLHKNQTDLVFLFHQYCTMPHLCNT